MSALDISPLTPHIGAEVRGVDLAGDLPDDTIAEIRAAWLEHLVVFFPDQHLAPEAHVAFARRFGEITEGHPVEPSLPGHPNVLPIDSEKDRVDFWHTDVTYMKKPPTGSLLYAVQLPGVGGDTMWTSTRVAYDTLAPQLQHFCDELTAIHFDPNYAQVIAEGGGQDWDGKHLDRLWPVEHPVVRVHPETGRRNLFVNPQFTLFIKGMEERESRTLLDTLFRATAVLEHQYRHRWSPDMLVFWDNRAAQHAAVHDYYPQRRLMERVTIKGDRPQGVGEVAKVSELRKFKIPPLMSFKERALRQHER